MNPCIIYLVVLILQFSEGIQLPDKFIEDTEEKIPPGFIVQLPENLNGNSEVFKDGSTYKNRNGVCSFDPFLSSEKYEGKVFLFPWKESERRGDWYENYGYCNKYCAEMVTIQSDAENNYFHWFMRNVGMTHPGAWLGAQIVNATSPSQWITREKVRFSNPAPGEYNERGLTCLHVGWDNGNNKWWNYYCSAKNMMIACQRSKA